ncbi:MAG: SDR family oxidoreductase [Pseudomonadota bacterium]
MSAVTDTQRVLILGGSGRMGRATAKAVIERGGTAILVGRDAGKLSRVAGALGDKATAVVADGNADGAISNLVTSEQPDHIVVAVSASARASDIPGTSADQAKRAFGRFWISYAAVQAAASLPSHGSITLLSGSSARTPAPGYGVWSTLHGSIEALARAAVIEIAPVRLNVVSPGGIDMSPDRQLVPRAGTADDIGQAIAALIYNPAITGAVLDVDSGERKGTWSGD